MPLTTLLIVTGDTAPAQAAGQAWLLRLQQAGQPVLAAVPCQMLVREAVRLAPQAVVALVDGSLDGSVDAPGASAGPLRDALALLAASAPRAVLLVGGAALPAAPPDLAQWLACHVMAWLPAAVAPPALGSAAALAAARFDQLQALRQTLDGTQSRLDERKWVDRAKGVLMRHQQLSEDDAFALLRAASMQANLRVGEVSRGVIEAAAAADAVNCAGQLRMLSQRLVKALALRAAAGGRGRVSEGDDLAETAQRLQARLDRLAALPAAEPAAAPLAATAAAWQALRLAAGLADPPQRSAVPTAAVLTAADHAAELLLDQADALTAALERASGRRNLQVVNLCGRQRMLSQRLAKQALLAGLLPDGQAADHAAAAALTIREFEATLAALEQAPLASAAIRAALAQARGQWLRLLDGLRRSAGPDAAAGRQVLARESEALLAGFEQLTSLYEHSMQVLLG